MNDGTMTYDELAVTIKEALGAAYIPAQDETIRAYIQAVKHRDQASDELTRTGLICESEGSMGQMKTAKNPLFDIWLSCAALAGKLLAELGLTPKVQKSMPDRDGTKTISDAAKRRADKGKGVAK